VTHCYGDAKPRTAQSPYVQVPLLEAESAQNEKAGAEERQKREAAEVSDVRVTDLRTVSDRFKFLSCFENMWRVKFERATLSVSI
jgi:hypothetical protein